MYTRVAPDSLARNWVKPREKMQLLEGVRWYITVWERKQKTCRNYLVKMSVATNYYFPTHASALGDTGNDDYFFRASQTLAGSVHLPSGDFVMPSMSMPWWQRPFHSFWVLEAYQRPQFWHFLYQSNLTAHPQRTTSPQLLPLSCLKLWGHYETILFCTRF